MEIINALLNFFRPINDYSERLEKFLKNKNIQSVAELEFWMREYEFGHSKKFIQTTE